MGTKVSKDLILFVFDPQEPSHQNNPISCALHYVFAVQTQFVCARPFQAFYAVKPNFAPLTTCSVVLEMTYSSWRKKNQKVKIELTGCYDILHFVRFAPTVDTLYEYPLSGLCLGPVAGGVTRARPGAGSMPQSLVHSQTPPSLRPESQSAGMTPNPGSFSQPHPWPEKERNGLGNAARKAKSFGHDIHILEFRTPDTDGLCLWRFSGLGLADSLDPLGAPYQFEGYAQPLVMKICSDL